MSIIIGTVVTWIAVTVFSLIPKKLTPFEIIFVFCIDTIFELSMFSILHVNLKFIKVEPGVSNGIADLMLRLIELPLLLVTSSNILLYSNKMVKWCGVAVIVLFTLIVQQILVQIKMISFHHWNVLYSGFFICGCIVFSRIMTWIITSLDKKETA
jgi:hypothetical protein